MPLSFCTRIKGRIAKMWLIMHSARFTSSHNLQGVVSYLNSSRSQGKASICQSILNESCGVGGFIITERNLIQPLFHINLNDHRHMFLIKLDNWTQYLSIVYHQGAVQWLLCGSHSGVSIYEVNSSILFVPEETFFLCVFVSLQFLIHFLRVCSNFRCIHFYSEVGWNCSLIKTLGCLLLHWWVFPFQHHFSLF